MKRPFLSLVIPLIKAESLFAKITMLADGNARFLAQFSLVEHTEQYVPKVAAKAIPLTYKRSYLIVVKSDIYVDLKQIGTKLITFT